MNFAPSGATPAVPTDHPIDTDIARVRALPAVRAIVIPPCPQALLRLQEILRAPEHDMGALDELVSSDVALAAAVMRQANSPLYGLQQPVQTVGLALTVLGFDPAVQLLSTFITRQALQVQSPLMEHFWQSSVRRAMACEHIGGELYALPTGLGYSYGLFCHIGFPVLVKAVRGYASTVTEALARKDRTFTQTENANHRTDHAVVGAIVARTWHLPGDVAQAIWLHHDFSCLEDERFPVTVRQLVALGALADYVVNHHEGIPPAREWQQHGQACLAFLQVLPEELEHWIDQLHPSLEGVGA